MAISPQALEQIPLLNDGIDHGRLDWEAENTRSRILSTNSVVTKLGLLYFGEPLGQATIRALDARLDSVRYAAYTSYMSPLEVRGVSIEDIKDVNPCHYHLGVLAAALAAINGYPQVTHLLVSPGVASAETLRSVVVHMPGWNQAEGALALERDASVAQAA
ncbi:MAG TPA: hypothetical protein VFB03_01590 [Candidatus Saccharimonadales bacterium]|nr:hypothetical protein [Candidatus Saccharimonadales bacterium]